MRNIISLCLLAVVLLTSCGNVEPRIIAPGEIWPDNNGVHVNAHGGGMLLHNGIYYWYGENKCDTTSSAMVGVDCYSSKDLVNKNISHPAAILIGTICWRGIMVAIPAMVVESVTTKPLNPSFFRNRSVTISRLTVAGMISLSEIPGRKCLV